MRGAGVTVVDTGVANLHSVTSALDRLGARWKVADDFGTVASADRIILPGVGSARAGMAALENKGLADVLVAFERPMLGICLGMQMLYEGLGESGGRGLGRLRGDMVRLDAGGQPLPHMGWNTLGGVTDDPLMDGVENGDFAYFVHSYATGPSGQSLATAVYGESFTAVGRNGYAMGCQFHPERSGSVGARILSNFMSL